ncbi:MAG: sodium:solute symporter family protein [Ignavibacteriaceae bacterium]
MVTFADIDIAVIVVFFLVVLIIGFIAGRKSREEASDYLLSGRNVGLPLFILTNVSTWYGGILGVGEFTYRYGIASWFTQGFPYYVFAFLFALFFAKKIRMASLFTIPDKLTQVYGRKAGLTSAVFIFILVSPAPYLLMVAGLISLIFGTTTFVSLLIALALSLSYLFKGGYRSDLYTDAFQFFIMFGGFIVIVLLSFSTFGGVDYLAQNLPAEHLQLTGGASPAFIIVWFLIALWTFADPGFHQRCYAAKDSNVAVKGILISIILWAVFDFLTTTTGLYARASLPGIQQPVLSFPLLAEKVLSPGLKGLFYAGLFATIMSTFNSFLFLSGTTIGRDFIFRMDKFQDESKLKIYTIIGLSVSGTISIILALAIPSVIEIWYTIGSFCIPVIILPVISAYYERFRIPDRLILFEMILAAVCSVTWYFIRANFVQNEVLYQLEPMIAGLTAAVLVHLYGLIKKDFPVLKK